MILHAPDKNFVILNHKRLKEMARSLTLIIDRQLSSNEAFLNVNSKAGKN